MDGTYTLSTFYHTVDVLYGCLGLTYSFSLLSGSYIQHVTFVRVLQIARHSFRGLIHITSLFSRVFHIVRLYFLASYIYYDTFFGSCRQYVNFFQGLTYTTEISSGSYIQYVTHSRDTVILSHLGDVIYGWFVRKLRPFNFITV